MNINDVSTRIRTEPGITNSELVNSKGKSIRGKSKDNSTVGESKLLTRLTETQNQKRNDLIRQAQAKVESGELLSRESAQFVADAILGDQKIFE